MIKGPVTDNSEISPAPQRTPGFLPALLAVLLGATLLLSVSGVGFASASITIPTNPDEQPENSGPAMKRAKVKSIARGELARKVRENDSDNVPRYRSGKGAVAPYGFRKGSSGPWCAAFATWTWGRAGFDEFRTTYPRPQYLVTTFRREVVAVQVKDLRNWAIRTGRRTLRATPGDLVAYGDRHIGVVMKVNRKKRAVRAIEGNLRDGVRSFKIPMTDIIDYFSPVPITPAQKSTRSILRPDVG